MKESVESLGRVRATGIAILAIAFLAGGLAGAAVERWRAGEGGGGFPVAPHARAGRLPPHFDRLDLTAEQRERIEEILESRHQRVDSVMGAMMPSLRAMADSLRSEIDAVLTPEQREKLASEMPRFRGARGFGPRPGEFGPGPGEPGPPPFGEGGPPHRRPGFGPPGERPPPPSADTTAGRP